MDNNDNTSTGIYHWKLGDIALARISRKIYSRVKVVKDEKGLFYDDKVLGISGNTDGSITVTKELCYYVETHHSKIRYWVPYTAMHLAERSRPFYGPVSKAPKESPKKKESPPKKLTNNPILSTPFKCMEGISILCQAGQMCWHRRKIKEDHTVPLDVKLPRLKEPDLNTTYDIRHIPLKQGKQENAFKEFVRRGKEMLFDEYFKFLQVDVDANKDSLEYLVHVDASTEDKFELVIQNVVSEKEIEHYLHQCWRYNYVHKQSNMSDRNDGTDNSKSLLPLKAPITIHTPWCLVCAKGERLRECPNCPASFHLACRKEWLVKIIHRKNPPKKPQKAVTLVEKILSSTRTICTVRKEKENVELCPSCMWGPKVGYDDIVWHKLGQCPWWPARVLTPGSTPSCLLSRNHSPHNWPLRYYGTLNHSWGCASRMCLFLPSHVSVPAASRDSELADALLDACDDYISVYLT